MHDCAEAAPVIIANVSRASRNLGHGIGHPGERSSTIAPAASLLNAG
jgi:hypothetical protein